MPLSFVQLTNHLRRGLAPLYLICGDEPYQFGEAAHQIRAAARAAGFAEREVLDVDAQFNWSALAAAADAMSLFAAKKLIELRLGAGKLGNEGAAAVRAYCDRLCADNLLLILAPELQRKDLQAQWAKRVDAVGVVVRVWPLKERELHDWIGERLRAAGFTPETGVVALLAERIEGNLLAAVQEVEKLRLLHDPGPLAVAAILGDVADQSRFDLFALTDAALSGDRPRAQRVLAALAAEGTADAVVLWVLARELRLLIEAAGQAVQAVQGGALAAFLASRGVPKLRLRAVELALRRLPTELLETLLMDCALADRCIKGRAPGDPWHHLARITDALAAGRRG